jgi:hypothetical protein
MGHPMNTGQQPGQLRSFMLAAMALVLTTQCTEGTEPPEGAGNSVEQCLTYKEVRDRCNEAFTECLHSRIQNIHSKSSGHSLCHVCQDVCMQENGVWPDRLWDGRPCR